MALKILVGRRFGKLIVVSELESIVSGSHKRRRFKCLCDCGNTKIIWYENITSGHTKSCGCLKSEASRLAHLTHGESQKNETVEYKTWTGIIARCYNQNETGFKNYGGRGIVMCEAWKNSFQSFLKDMGRRPTPTHTIDRINNNGNYEPSNCKWSTKKEQGKNKRNNHWIECNGETMIFADWVRKLDIGDAYLRKLLKIKPMELIVAKYDLTNQLNSINKKYSIM
jgi:hypothetical protein